MSKAGTVIQFEYDHNGLRTKKTVTESGVTTVTEYRLHGSLVTHLTKGTDSLHFYYDAAGRPIFVDYNGTMYAYVHNLQGDITGILDSTGALVVTYSYDAWGKPVQTNGSMANTLGKINPFRYRGYVFDEETGLYYLQSRYYDPNTIKLINIDSIIVPETEIVGNNKQTYCCNNPIVMVVETETSPQINENPKREIVRKKTKVVCSTNGIYVGAARGLEFSKGIDPHETDDQPLSNCYTYALHCPDFEDMSPGNSSHYFDGTTIKRNI